MEVSFTYDRIRPCGLIRPAGHSRMRLTEKGGGRTFLDIHEREARYGAREIAMYIRAPLAAFLCVAAISAIACSGDSGSEMLRPSTHAEKQTGVGRHRVPRQPRDHGLFSGHSAFSSRSDHGGQHRSHRRRASESPKKPVA